MAYGTRGKKPFERASRSSHHHLINDPEVQRLLSASWLPSHSTSAELPTQVWLRDEDTASDIEHFLAIDGGYQEAVVEPRHPSASLCFMQFGAVAFTKSDLASVDSSPHPAPEDMQRLRNLERLKLALPMRNMRLANSASFIESFRAAVHDFLVRSRMSNVCLADTLKWLVFREFSDDGPAESWHLATNPNQPESGEGVDLIRGSMDEQFAFTDPTTSRRIYLADVLRLHERLDEELGGAGVLGFLTNALEQLLVAHLLRLVFERRRSALRHIVLIKDGPLAFFGLTANLHAPMRDLIAHMAARTQIHIAGVEKSGPFVEHAHQIRDRISPGSALLLDDDYVYNNILPGRRADADGTYRPYGANTYYGRKVIFRSSSGYVYVLTVPTTDVTSHPIESDFVNLRKVLRSVELLHCDMYDDSLFPVALANKLVSLSAHPSQRILERFAASAMQR